MDELRKEILRNLETNSRINIAELAVLLDVEKAAVANEVARMDLWLSYADRLGKSRRRTCKCID